MRTVLLNPGPVTLTERVRLALVRDDMCHREPDFAEICLDIKQKLLQVYAESPSEYDAILLAGSGTCAVEAMLASFAPRETRTLVVTNGVYGERMAAMLTAHGRPHEVLTGDWLAPLDLAEVERRLTADPTLTHVATVQHETTTGRLNDLDGVVNICQRLRRSILLDAVSSFGAERIDFDNECLAAVAGTGGKCLHGVPGTAFVIARRSLFAAKSTDVGCVYLDLFRYQKEQLCGFSPFTPAVQSCFALQEALSELQESGGWKARRARYRNRSSHVRNTLLELGVSMLLPAEAYSSMLTSFVLPEGSEYPALHDELRAAGFVIYASQGALVQRAFRIATMGDITPDDLARLSAALGSVMRGLPCLR